jgi:V/A-type H+-transporting ATPase subunit A
LTLICAELVNDAFLRQSAFSSVDRVCTPAKAAAMMKLVGRFCDLAERAVAGGVAPSAIAQLDSLRALARMGEDVGNGELERCAQIAAAMERQFAQLARAAEGADAAHG